VKWLEPSSLVEVYTLSVAHNPSYINFWSVVVQLLRAHAHEQTDRLPL